MRLRLLFCLLLCSAGLHASRFTLVRPVQVTFPTPTRTDLDQGYVEKGGSRINHAFRVYIRPGSESGTPYRVYLRTKEDYFEPEVFMKSTTDLEWKFNEDNTNAYRFISSTDQLIFYDPVGDDRTLRLDLRCLLSWKDQPASYYSDLIFTVEFD